ncbi:uncharacterized protein MONOS_11039 [Monocercomonoides exilis]|uniref:uncharacterized protein n=1 Tax=Monocercomonoides exilis TaxID=2049356 RepID=UPI00355974EE|nr:hypothetical protein MONOS_11039 [Monocercomonoides exilis]
MCWKCLQTEKIMKPSVSVVCRTFFIQLAVWPLVFVPLIVIWSDNTYDPYGCDLDKYRHHKLDRHTLMPGESIMIEYSLEKVLMMRSIGHQKIGFSKGITQERCLRYGEFESIPLTSVPAYIYKQINGLTIVSAKIYDMDSFEQQLPNYSNDVKFTICMQKSQNEKNTETGAHDQSNMTCDKSFKISFTDPYKNNFYLPDFEQRQFSWDGSLEIISDKRLSFSNYTVIFDVAQNIKLPYNLYLVLTKGGMLKREPIPTDNLDVNEELKSTAALSQKREHKTKIESNYEMNTEQSTEDLFDLQHIARSSSYYADSEDYYLSMNVTPEANDDVYTDLTRDLLKSLTNSTNPEGMFTFTCDASNDNNCTLYVVGAETIVQEIACAYSYHKSGVSVTLCIIFHLLGGSILFVFLVCAPQIFFGCCCYPCCRSHLKKNSETSRTYEEGKDDFDVSVPNEQELHPLNNQSVQQPVSNAVLYPTGTALPSQYITQVVYPQQLQHQQQALQLNVAPMPPLSLPPQTSNQEGVAQNFSAQYPQSQYVIPSQQLLIIPAPISIM